MNCDCHGEPLVWKADRRWAGGGSWRCPVSLRNSNQGRERQLRYWHKADGGYMRRRRRHLAEQRQAILTRIAELEQEATVES